MSIKLVAFSVLMGMATCYFGASSAQAFGETIPGINKSIALFKLKAAEIEYPATTEAHVDQFCTLMGYDSGTRSGMYKFDGGKLLWAFCYRKDH